jgi:signal peptidase I
MRPSSFENGDPQAGMNGGDPGHSRAGGANPGNQARSAAAPATSPTTERKGHDYRLRGLHLEPTAGSQAPSDITDQRKRRRRVPVLAKVALFVALAALAVLLLQAFVIQPFSVPGDAMTPTLQTGDRILVLKSGLLAGPIRAGDIIVFHPPRTLRCSVVGRQNGDLVLRVVALPGEVIRSARDTILVDGRPLRERGWYDARFGQVGTKPIPRTALGSGQYFVLADNRSDACDSRAFGPISSASVVGKGVAVVGRNGHVSFGTF